MSPHTPRGSAHQTCPPFRLNLCIQPHYLSQRCFHFPLCLGLTFHCTTCRLASHVADLAAQCIQCAPINFYLPCTSSFGTPCSPINPLLAYTSPPPTLPPPQTFQYKSTPHFHRHQSCCTTRSSRTLCFFLPFTSFATPHPSDHSLLKYTSRRLDALHTHPKFDLTPQELCFK